MISNLPTADGYTEALTLGPVPTTEKIVFLIANASVICQVAGSSKAGTIQPWSDEILLAPETAEFQRVQGIRFRSAVPGTPARIIAQLIEPDDPVPVGGQPFTSVLNASGGIAGIGGGMDLLFDFVVPAVQANIDFPAIPQTYKTLQIEALWRNTAAGVAATPFIRLNNDAGLVYDYQFDNSNAAAAASGRSVAQNAGVFGIISNAGAAAGVAGSCWGQIPNYTNTSFFKSVLGEGLMLDGTIPQGYLQRTGTIYRSLNPITQLTLFPDGAGGTFVPGSRLTVYGIA